MAIRSAIAITPAGPVTAGHKIRNSSPPRRAKVSVGRTTDHRRSANRTSTASPPACLNWAWRKLSTSITNTATRPPVRAARSRAVGVPLQTQGAVRQTPPPRCGRARWTAPRPPHARRPHLMLPEGVRSGECAVSTPRSGRTRLTYRCRRPTRARPCWAPAGLSPLATCRGMIVDAVPQSQDRGQQQQPAEDGRCHHGRDEPDPR